MHTLKSNEPFSSSYTKKPKKNQYEKGNVRYNVYQHFDFIITWPNMRIFTSTNYMILGMHHTKARTVFILYVLWILRKKKLQLGNLAAPLEAIKAILKGLYCNKNFNNNNGEKTPNHQYRRKYRCTHYWVTEPVRWLSECIYVACARQCACKRSLDARIFFSMIKLWKKIYGKFVVKTKPKWF